MMVLVLSLKKKKKKNPAVFDVAYIFIRICYDILIVKNTGKQILLRIIKTLETTGISYLMWDSHLN